MDTQQPPAPITGVDSGGDGVGGNLTKSSPLDDMFGDDPITISQIVGQLESSIESSLMNSISLSSTVATTITTSPPSISSSNNNDKSDNISTTTSINNITTNTSQNSSINIVNSTSNTSNNSPLSSTTTSQFHQTSNGTLYNNINSMDNNKSGQASLSSLSSSALMSVTTTTTTNLSNHHNQTESSLSSDTTTTTNQPPQSSDGGGGGGKRILLSANSQPVNSSISNMTQQPQTMMKSSPLTNGTMTPPQSPSLSSLTTSQPQTTTLTSSTLSSTSLQQQHTIPVGQLVAAATFQQTTSQSHVGVNNSNSTSSITGTIRSPSSLTTPLTPNSLQQQTSAISSSSATSFVMTPNQNKMTTQIAQKSNSALLTIQSNGQPQQMLIGQPTSTNQPNNLNMRPPNTVQMPQVSLPNSMIATTGGNNLVLDPRSQAQQQIQLQQLAVSQNPGSQNVQFQIVNVNSPSRPPTLTVPTAACSVSAGATGYTVSNIITGTNATTIQTGSKTASPLAPRLVQLHPNAVRLSGVRSGAPGFTAPLALPGLVRGQTILVKTENGQVHMVNVGPQALTQPGQSPTQPTIRLQVPTATGTTTVSTGNAPGGPTIRTQLAGSQIVLPVTLATGAVNNTSMAAAIQATANKTTPVPQAPSPQVVSSIPPPTTPGTSATSSTTHQQPLSVHTTAANTQAASAAPSQMSPTTAKKKCKNFLSTLIRLASDQPESVASNVKTLIQGLIDDTIQPEDFTNQLQKELNSSPQPCLVPFLKKSLPYLRYSLMKEELTIDGVRPPPANAMAIPSNVTHVAQTLSHIQNIGTVPTQQQSRSSLPPGVRLLAPTGPAQLAAAGPNLIATAAGNVPAGTQIITSLQPPPQGPPNHNTSIGPIVLTSSNHPHQPITHHHHHPHPTSLISQVTTMTPSIQTTNTSIPQSHQPRLPAIHQHQAIPPPPPPTTVVQMSTPPTHPSVSIKSSTKSKSSSKSKAKSEKAKKEKEEKAAAAAAAIAAAAAAAASHQQSTTASSGGDRGGLSSFRDDDDINDVAAMGGVNLVEESQRILAGNAEIIGQQIRSCKDEPFLYASPLHQKLNKIAKRYDLEDCSHDVVALVSHATEERLKTLVEQLGVIAEHRQEQLRNNPNYEIVQDVKGQAQFLQELDRIEKRRHEEQEREVLIKAAKSRSKVDDPDHIAIKARAKEMQRLEMEEIRQREANETALQAIGNPKKRLKTMAGSSASGNVGASNTFGLCGSSVPNNSTSGIGSSVTNSIFNTFVSKPIKRIKRVTMKDVLFMMERDRTTVRSTVLYKAYAR